MAARSGDIREVTEAQNVLDQRSSGMNMTWDYDIFGATAAIESTTPDVPATHTEPQRSKPKGNKVAPAERRTTTKTSSKLAAATMVDPLPHATPTALDVNKRVYVEGCGPGAVRYYGRPAFGGTEHCFVGVELDDPTGNNDGTVDVRLPSMRSLHTPCLNAIALFTLP